MLRLFAGWCVLVPYWWYAERRWLAPGDPAARVEFDALQAQSRLVWLGFLAAMGVLILARGR